MQRSRPRIGRPQHRQESLLSVRLFRRTTRRMNPTDTVQSVYERCLRILADVQEGGAGRLPGARDPARATAGGRPPVLRLAIPRTGHRRIPAGTPGSRVRPRSQRPAVDLLVEGFDLAVRIADLQDTTLIARRLATVRHVVRVGPAYMAGHGIPPSPAELTGHACLVYANSPTPGLREYVDTAGREGRVQVRAHLPANNGDCLRQVAEDGYGIVMGPSFILYQSIEGGRLLPILTDDRWPTLHAYAVYPSTRHLSRRVRTFLGRLPGWRRQPQPLAGPRPRSPSPLHVDGVCPEPGALGLSTAAQSAPHLTRPHPRPPSCHHSASPSALCVAGIAANLKARSGLNVQVSSRNRGLAEVAGGGVEQTVPGGPQAAKPRQKAVFALARPRSSAKAPMPEPTPGKVQVAGPWQAGSGARRSASCCMRSGNPRGPSRGDGV